MVTVTEFKATTDRWLAELEKKGSYRCSSYDEKIAKIGTTWISLRT